jgi:protein phosphatase
VCRDEAAAQKRFGISGDGGGIVYTRTGRRFFDDRSVEAELLEHVRRACEAAGLWREFDSDWFCLDCELMPWSAKAQELLKNQYAAVGSAGRSALGDATAVLQQANERYLSQGIDALAPVPQQHEDRLTRVNRYVEAYRRYCWPVRSAADLKLAPFHLLASEGRVHVDKDHAWHMEALRQLATEAASPLIATDHRVVDVTDPASMADGLAWWEDLTARGGEGMVVKPLEFIVGRRGLVQPAVKCRGREYLRIIYGPEYDIPQNLDRLRSRGLGAHRHRQDDGRDHKPSQPPGQPIGSRR